MLTEDERSDLHERAQDFVRTATVYDGLLRRLSNPEWDKFVERVGQEVCEVVMRRMEEKTDELEAKAVGGEVGL